MLKKYFSQIMVFLITTLVFILIIFSTRYETNIVEVRDYKECLILTNLFTGNSCLIGGWRGCSSYNDNLKECD